MLLLGSRNAVVGFPAAWEVLREGGSALDAVEVATRAVEDNEEDHSVGYAGYPNLLGDVELDASLMCGTTRRVGAVGAVQGFRHPISIARAVMDLLPHSLLVGAGAERFATELGMTKEDLLTEHSRSVWREGIEGKLPAGSVFATSLARLTALAADPEHVAGTVNVIARDSAGHLASAVSTSGWAWKHPGRLGDSPVPGAGNYADDRYGAAACTGLGELAIRSSLARVVVYSQQLGVPIDEAVSNVIADLGPLTHDYPTSSIIQLVAVDVHGEPHGYTTGPEDYHVVMRSGWDEPRTLPSTRVAWDADLTTPN